MRPEGACDRAVPPSGRRIFTIGHSNHPLEIFVDLLKKHRIDVVVDVRSQPHSRYTPHFDAPELKSALPKEGIKYLFMGKEIGGRPEGREFYDQDGRVLYDRLAESPVFMDGISRLERRIAQDRVALMCGEEDPTGCHRRLLIGRVLVDRGIDVCHIRGDGRLQTGAELAEEEERKTRDPAQLPLFDMPEEKAWRSTRSVSLRERRPPSSEH